MQAVILSAGQASRFYPLTTSFHKSMIKVMDKPVLEHTISSLKKAGIKDIVLITNNDKKVSSYFEDGKKFGVSIKYAVQNEPTGAGNAIICAKELINGDFILLHGGHVDIVDYVKKLIDSKKEKDSSVLLVEKKKKTWEYGVVKASNGKLDYLVEKPVEGKEPSNFCVISIYFFEKKIIEEIEKTPDEHYRLESAISSFAQKNSVRIVEVKNVITFKYPWDLFAVKDYLFKSLKQSLSKKAIIAKSASIEGNVVIEDGATIMDGAKIIGPCYIGKNAFVGNNSIIRNGVDIEENSVVGAFSEIKNSIIMNNSKTHSGFIGDSVIGENCRIGAQFCTSNVRIDRDTVKTMVKNIKTDTGLKSLGFICGNNVKIGIKSTTMPGVIIGNNSVIGPSTTVMENVEDNTKYYSKIQGIVSKK